ncbi:MULTISPECIES: MarR family winged helix-turn-helix transcriptional regulator [Carnobacterium]|uniref:MarR family winged helix-turn-helix transcriptional regulator n=1 Tax=Carnobacterium TaxID=2747 RepID=UPI00055425DB|nr:MarR family transcriptional regulator [Carnobacterium inhibens]MCM3512568.1 MarR family transcriptional regulator [Carnobacterium inhibens]
MDRQLSEEYIDACLSAKHTMRFLPEPPPEVQKRHIHIIKTVYNLSEELNAVRVSDIAETIGVTLPSITKNIATLEDLGYIKKESNLEDKRVVNIKLTEKGLALHQKVVYDFHQKNSQILKDIPEEDIRLTIKTIYRIHDLMEQAHLLS